jgi:LytS/YehU family sensor histidine kinase
VNYILLGRRKGGRRYLSEDLRALARLAGATAERLENLRTAEMKRLVSQAEFRALQSQINPHFLFNALNALYGIIPRNAAGARRTVLHLAEIFRYFLQTDKKLIRLSEELEIVRAYLEIETLRFGPRLQVEIDVDDAALRLMIPVLSIEPLVENAVKHGVAASSKPEWVRLKIRSHEDRIVIRVENTRSGIQGPPLEPAAAGAGVGLANVTRRLRLCYGQESALAMEFKAEETVVEFSVPSTRFAMAG